MPTFSMDRATQPAMTPTCFAKSTSARSFPFPNRRRRRLPGSRRLGPSHIKRPCGTNRASGLFAGQGGTLMKRLFLCALAFQFATAPAIAQSAGNPALSMDQQSKISEIITRQTPQPLTNIDFSVARDVVIPSNVPLQRLPAEAEQVAPQLKGDSYLAVEELVAIVDTNSRKVISVMQRMRRQENTK